MLASLNMPFKKFHLITLKNPLAESEKNLENRKVNEEGSASTGPLSLNLCMLFDKNKYKVVVFWLLA